jgi:hypothetical protein
LVDKSILARKKKLNPVTELVLGTTYARQLAKEAHSKRLREVSPAPTASSSSQSNGASKQKKRPPKSKGKYPKTLRCKYCKGKVTAKGASFSWEKHHKETCPKKADWK